MPPASRLAFVSRASAALASVLNVSGISAYSRSSCARGGKGYLGSLHQLFRLRSKYSQPNQIFAEYLSKQQLYLEWTRNARTLPLTLVALQTSIVPGGYRPLPKGVSDTVVVGFVGVAGAGEGVPGVVAVGDERRRPITKRFRALAIDFTEKCSSSVSSQISSPFHTT